MEEKYRFYSQEQARNGAIKWLEERGVQFGPHQKPSIGRLGVGLGNEVGVEGTAGVYWRLRLDWDPSKQAHYNVEYGKGADRVKAAFCFTGDEAVVQRILQTRGLR